MWHMARVHLRGVGHPDIRFDPLDLDLTDRGRPCDSVIWLENGGGKTSLLSLMFAVLRPAAREFLSSRYNRSLANYVGSGDVGHVVIEWRRPADGLPGLSDDAVLITGMTVEWTDLRARPDNRSALNRSYWGLRAVDGYGLDQLPFSDEAGRPRRARAFAEQLARDLDHVPSARLHRPDDNHGRWHEWLQTHGLDPEVYRFQVVMNADEGAIAEAFTFASGDAFVEWALKIVADPGLPGAVAKALEGVTNRIHQLPRLRLERQLCDGAARHLGDLAAAHELIAEADAKLDELRRDGRRLARSIELAAEDAERTAAEEEERGKREEEDARRANTERRQAQRHANRWLQLAAEVELDTARTAHEQAAAAADEAAVERDAWDLTDRLDEQQHLTREQRNLKEQLERLEEGLTPLKDQLAGAEQALAARVAHLTADMDARLQAMTEQRQSAQQDERADADTETRLREERDAATRTHAEAAATIERAEARREQAGQTGMLEPGEDPQEAVERSAGELEGADKALAAALGERDSAEDGVGEADDAVAAAKDEQRQADVDHREARRALEDMRSQAAALERDEAMIDATQADPADVWAQPAVTLERLHRAADDARRAHVDARLDAVETDRIVEALETHGYAPPSRTVETGLQVLAQAGVPAVSGYRYLADAVPDHERLAALRAAPDVTAGIVVTDPDRLDEAVAVLDDLEPAAAPLTLAAPATLTDRPGELEHRRVIAPDPALYDRASADTLKTTLTEHSRQIETATEAARTRVATVEQTIARYEQLHRAWPDPSGTTEAEKAASSRLQTATGEVGRAAEAAAKALQRRSQARETATDARTNLDTVRRQHQQLEDLAQAWSDREAARSVQQEATAVLRRTDDELEQLAERRERRSADLQQLAGEEADLTRRRTEHANTLRRVRVVPVEAHSCADPGGSVESLEQAVNAHRDALTQARSETALAERVDQVAVALADIAAALHDAEATTLARARVLLGTAEGADRMSRRQARKAAVGSHAELLKEVGRVAAEMKAATQSQQDADALDGADLPEGTVVPADAAARRRLSEATLNRAQQLNEARTKHLARAEHARREAQKAGERARLLHQTLGHLSGELDAGPAGADVVVYPHDPSVADEEVRALRRKLKEWQDLRSEAGLQRQDAHHQLSRFVRSERFTPIVGDDAPTSRIVDRLADEDPARLAAGAVDLETELRRRAAGIDKDIEEVDEHRQLLVDQLVAIARDAVKLLAAVETRSRMPDDLAEWSKRRFIQIRHDPLPDDPSVLADRIGRVVDLLVDQQVTPDADQLLYRAARAAVGDQGFTVRIIKPHMDLHYDRVDITELLGFSGGQKVTTAIALFITMLNMRADTHGSGAHGHRTTLVLDNPFGKSSADAFVTLQRQVAERLGVQLLYTTAVKDLAALSQFRRVIRLDHRRNRRSGELHVVAASEPKALVGVAVTRGDAPTSGDEPAA